MSDSKSSLPSPPSNISSLVYFGTPYAAVPQLYALHEAGYSIPLVVTKVDAKRGRGSKLTPSPVKKAALDLGLRVSHDPKDVLGVQADMGVVIAYGAIIKAELLETIPLVNIHFSLLPRWRGAAPVERAIMAGDSKTGICLMALDYDLDTGDIYKQQTVEIKDNESALALKSRLVDLSCDLLVDVLKSGFDNPTPQVGEPVYAKKIDKSELKLDFSETAVQCQRRIRIGKTWTMFRGKRLSILKANALESSSGMPGAVINGKVQTSNGSLELLEVQPEGKQAMSAGDWLRGYQIKPDETLG